MAHERRCAHCGTVLEQHEPVVVTVRDTHVGRTSLAALGELGDDAIALVHERGHATGAGDAPSKAPTGSRS